MNIISIDPGKLSLGYFICKRDKTKISGTIKSKRTEDLKTIYERIAGEIERLKEEHQIEAAFLEGYSFGSFGKSKSVSHLAEVIGIVKYILLKGQSPPIRIIVVPIGTWKAALQKVYLPKTKGKKYLAYVNDHFKRKFETCDEADAFMITVAMYYVSKGFVCTDSHLRLKKEMDQIEGLFSE